MRDFPCQTVDAFVTSQGLSSGDLVKFDLEAGEVNAIPGLLATIERFRPQMAISV